MRSAILITALSAIALQAEHATWIQARNIRLVNTIQISPTEVDLIFKVDAYNNDTNPAIGVTASVRSTTYNSAILAQPILIFPDIPAFGTVSSINTFSVRQNTQFQFTENLIRFFFEITPQGCRIGNQVYPNGAINPANGCQQCIAGANLTGWTDRPAGVTCSDGNSCTSGDVCNGAGSCGGAAVACNDNNACTADSCDPATGACRNTAISCNDNNACTVDSCDPVKGCINTAVSCNDNNACTLDFCDTGTGKCAYRGLTCDDNNACTRDSCDVSNGACVHSAIICDDANACTADSCSPSTGCQNALIVCNDNNACTVDSCNPATGCTYTDNGSCGGCNPLTDACNLSYTSPGSNACVTQSRVCAPHPLQLPVETLSGSPKLDLCLTLDSAAGRPLDASCDPSTATCQRSGCSPETGGCQYLAKVCLSETKGVGVCNPDTGGCVYGGVEEPASAEVPLTRLASRAAPAAALDGCQEMGPEGQVADKCARLTQLHPDSIYACVNHACVARKREPSDVCAAPEDPCLVRTGAEGVCTYGPRDCGAEFGNDPRYTYACQVDRSRGVPQAVCTRSAQCQIGDRFVADGAFNPENACQVCDATANANGWSNRPEATACMAGGAQAGQCRLTGVSTVGGFSGVQAMCQPQ